MPQLDVVSHSYTAVKIVWTNSLKIKEVSEDIIIIMMKEVKEITVIEKDKEDFENATNCFICGNDFKPEDKKVRSHCHFTGTCRGCAHDDCNLGFSMRYFRIPVFLHNLENYDAHLITNKAHELNKNSQIDRIAQNSEKFV